jgi:hypothetical protein
MHPIVEFVPSLWYSIERGNYANAAFFYTVAFLNYAFVMILDSKFIMIMLERRYAFKNRMNYEAKDGSTGFKITILAFILSSVMISIRIAWVFAMRDVNESLDETMQVAFIAERQPVFFVNVHATPVISSILGVYVRLKISTYSYAFRN